MHPLLAHDSWDQLESRRSYKEASWMVGVYCVYWLILYRINWRQTVQTGIRAWKAKLCIGTFDNSRLIRALGFDVYIVVLLCSLTFKNKPCEVLNRSFSQINSMKLAAWITVVVINKLYEISCVYRITTRFESWHSTAAGSCDMTATYCVMRHAAQQVTVNQ